MDWEGRTRNEFGRDPSILERMVIIARTERAAPIVGRLATFADAPELNEGRGRMRVHYEGRSDDVRGDIRGVVSRGYEVSAESRE